MFLSLVLDEECRIGYFWIGGLVGGVLKMIKVYLVWGRKWKYDYYCIKCVII